MYSTPFLVAKLCNMVLVAFDAFSEVEALNWIALLITWIPVSCVSK